MKMFVKVRTGKKEERVARIDDSHYEVTVRARREKGRANEVLLGVLAEYFKIPKSALRICTGHTSTTKVVEILTAC